MPENIETMRRISMKEDIDAKEISMIKENNDV